MTALEQHWTDEEPEPRPFTAADTRKQNATARRSSRMLQARIRRLFDLIDERPELWYLCDGEGGHVYDLIREEVERRGYPTRHNRQTHVPLRRTIPNRVRKAVYERDAYRCVTCGTHLDLSLDHVIPVTRGGTDDEGNLQTMCKTCNSRKGTS